MKGNLVERKFGHGGIKSKYDPRDRKVSRLGMASVPFDWGIGFDIEQKIGHIIPTENQGQSSSCGGQAARYYIESLEMLSSNSFDRFSAKDIYSAIFYRDGGTTTKDIGRRIGDHGVAKEIAVTSYQNGNPPSESFMRDTTASKAIYDSDRFAPVSAYARSELDFDSLAVAIRDNNGVILMVHGEDNGTWLTEFPVGAKSLYLGWNHFLYAGKVKMINGKKYIGVKNSWGDIGNNGWQWLDEGHKIIESLVFYDKATYTYTPTKPQAVISWASKFSWFKGAVDWFTKYHWVN